MASEKDGRTNQKEILLQKLYYLREQYAIASDASIKFTLQMQIAEVEKEIKEIDLKLAPISSNIPSNKEEKNPYESWIKLWKKSWIIGIIMLIFLLVTKSDEFLTAFDNLWNRLHPISRDTTAQDTLIQTDTSTKPPVIDTPIIERPLPNPPKPRKDQASPKKYISVRLILDIAYEKATIFANNVPIYPVNNAPLIKELSIEYKGEPIELIIKTPEKTCTHHITVSDDYFKKPQTIEKICSQ